MPTITYCSNVHSISDFDDVLAHLLGPTADVARGIHATPFPIGLWIPQKALEGALHRVGELQEILKRQSFEVVTFNAFPMGPFHGEPVKARVYLPDWSSEERLRYTMDIGSLAVALGHDVVSISSVSGGFRWHDHPQKVSQYIDHWLMWTRWAVEEEEKSGVCLQLALEPEPLNTMEDHRDAIRLWEQIRDRASHDGIDQHDLDRHLGLCFDTCHFSVRFQSLAEAWRALRTASIPVFKVQVSVAPRCADVQDLDTFFALAEPVYLHQTYHRDALGTVREFLDLPEAQEASKMEPHGEWRTHFHVPIHWGHRPDTTGRDLTDFLKTIASEEGLPLFEVETYSFDALKKKDRGESLVDSIVREIQWCHEQLGF